MRKTHKECEIRRLSEIIRLKMKIKWQLDGRNKTTEIWVRRPRRVVGNVRRKKSEKNWLRLLRSHAVVGKKRHVKNGFQSQNSALPLFYSSEPALPAVRLGGRETRPLVAASDRFQSPTMLCPSQITIHFWLPCFSSVWIQKAMRGSFTTPCSSAVFFPDVFYWSSE